MPSAIESLAVIRHLQDIDNLVQNGTDNPLAPNQDRMAIAFSTQLVQEAKQQDYHGIVLVSSPKKRAMETAQIIQRGIIQSDDQFGVSLIINHNLRELDQGKFVFPPGYRPGDFFEPLADAWQIFWSETFIDDHNLLYRFGSPYSHGKLRYPKLKDNFLSYGENYRDYAVRLYSAVCDFGQRIGRLRYLKPVVITHDSPRVIFRELEYIGKQIQMRNIAVIPGDLPQLTWDTYSMHEPSRLDFGECSVISFKALLDPKILRALQEEIEVLKQLS